MLPERKSEDLSAREKLRLKTKDGIEIALRHNPKTPADFFELASALAEQKAYKGDEFVEISYWITFKGPKWSSYDKELNILKLSADLMRNAAAGKHPGALEYVHNINKLIAEREKINAYRMASTTYTLKQKLGIKTDLPLLDEKIKEHTIQLIKEADLTQKLSSILPQAKPYLEKRLAEIKEENTTREQELKRFTQRAIKA